MEHGELGRHRPQHTMPREMKCTSHRLFTIREMPPANECGLLEVPVKTYHPARRPGTEISRRCEPATSSSRIDHRTTIKSTTRATVREQYHIPLFIYIAPGVKARLRGVEETVECIANDHYLSVACVWCAQNLFCIVDVRFVLCPTSKVVGLLDGGTEREFNDGVGIGFTIEELQTIQHDIYTSRQR